MQLVIFQVSCIMRSAAPHSIQSYTVKGYGHMESMCIICADLMAQKMEINYEPELKGSRPTEERAGNDKKWAESNKKRRRNGHER